MAIKFIGVAVLLGTLALSACTPDVIVRNEDKVTVIGEVLSETVVTNLRLSTEDSAYVDVVPVPLSRVQDVFTDVWKDADPTSFLIKPLEVKMSTKVLYTGTKGVGTVTIDVRTVTCPVGFMVGTCISAVGADQDAVTTLYKQKFSYLQ